MQQLSVIVALKNHSSILACPNHAILSTALVDNMSTNVLLATQALTFSAIVSDRFLGK